MTKTSGIQIDTSRLMADLDALRDIGRCGTGVVRRAFTPTDLAARQWLAGRMQAAGLAVHVDAVGNLFGLPPGDRPCLLVGSHSDTQPEGGWVDGAYGVIAGLEIARAALECGGPPVACVSFQDEEGRFAALAGSGVWSGRADLAETESKSDENGIVFTDARREAGWPGPVGEVAPRRFHAFLEMHIEQGPVLDRSGDRIGVVESIVGIRAERMSLAGEQNHAGTTPMHLRRDAFQGLVAFMERVNARFAEIVTPATVWTVGHVRLHPNASSIVPGRVDFSVQWRDAENARLDAMREILYATAREIAAERDLVWERSGYQAVAPTTCDAGLVRILCECAEAKAAGAWRRMPSGALHDAANVAAKMPVAMLFVPSIGGVSHSFDEDTDRADLVLGAEVLALAAGRIAPPGGSG